jgi:uncharacterized protein YciI
MIAAAILSLVLTSGVAVPAPRSEAERYVAEHPAMFAQRRLMVVEQIQAQPIPDADVKALAPMRAFEEVERFLDSTGVQHRRTLAIVDSLTTDPRLVEQIDALPKGELFVVSNSGLLTVNQLHETRSMPITGATAVDLARRGLLAQRTAQPPAQPAASAGGVYAFIYSKGAAWQAGKPLDQQGLGPHGVYLKGLFEKGQLLAGGPFDSGEGGMAVVRAANEAQAKAWLAADPAITAGIFKGELQSWSLRFDGLKLKGP